MGHFVSAKYGIPVGAKIKYINDPSIEVVVVDDRHVSYKGVTTSTSALAKELFGKVSTRYREPHILHMKEKS